jgi:ABC-type antimicrobial peptide transport system permease subunit
MTIGMVAAVVIVCTVPLFANVMNTAGLRQELRADPNSAEIEIDTTTLGLSTQVAANVQDLFAALMKQDLEDLAQPSQFTILSSNFAFATPSKDVRSLLLYGVSMQQAASHLGPIQGHLAQITTARQHEIEVMMTPDSARKLGLKVGDAFPLQLTFSLGPLGSSHTQAITARIAGLFTVDAANSSYWHGEDFKHFQTGSGAGTVSSYTMLVSNESLLAIADGLAAQYQTRAIFSLGQTLRWYYQLDVPRITIDQLDTLIGDCASLQADYTSNFGYLEDGNAPPNPVFPYLSSTQLSSPLLSETDNPSNLENFRSRIAVVQIPAILLTIQIILVILFFISLMTSLLIESQASTIALLRSRGASRSQVFGSLFIYFVALGAAAVLIGVPLTILATVVLAQRFLPVDGRDAIGLIANHPWQATEQILWYAVGMLLVMLLAMVISLHFAVRMDVLALRRESARAHKRPLWQRLNLDLFAGVIAIVGYVLSLYLNSIGNLLQGGTQVLVITPISVIAPFFLVLGCLLLLLRLFPLLLRLGAWLAIRGRGAASMLALAQVSRAPRQSIRTTMLLALSIAFLLFTVVYQSTQTQHIQDVTNYLTSADFSWDLTTSVAGAAQAETIRPYQAIPGVITASIGFVGTGIGGTGDLPMEIRAVDATNFGQTVIWPSAAAAQTGNALLKQLVDLRGSSLLGSVVPAIVDTITMNKLHVHVGSLFQVTVDGYENSPMNGLIIGVVPHIPSINDLTSFDNQGKALSEGGVLVDYQTYAKAFTREVQSNPHLRAPNPAPLNHIWLHTRDDAASVASVRIALTRLNLLNLSDRRAILAALNTDPLYLILSGTLTIGTVAALLLALIGTLLTSWLSARTRLTNFAVLRAIGATPRQIASMLTWEQAVVYLTGLLLGVGIGEFVVQTVVPALTLTNSNTNVSSNQFYTLQTTFPTQIVLPLSLLLALLALVAIYGIALTMMVRIVSQPSLSQTLRLNED